MFIKVFLAGFFFVNEAMYVLIKDHGLIFKGNLYISIFI